MYLQIFKLHDKIEIIIKYKKYIMWECLPPSASSAYDSLWPKNQKEIISSCNTNKLDSTQQQIADMFLGEILKEDVSATIAELQEETKWKVWDLLLALKWNENELISYINQKQHSLPNNSRKLDDFRQLVKIKEIAQQQMVITNNQKLESQKETLKLKKQIEQLSKPPFEVTWGQILTQNINRQWGLKFKKGKKQWKELWNDERKYIWNNRWLITIDNNNYWKHNIEIEYEWWNVVKVFDKRHNTMQRINIISKEMSVKEINRQWSNKIRIEEYKTLREIDIPYAWKKIRLQLIFHK